MMIGLVILALSVLVVAWLTAGAMALRSASRIFLRHWAERRLRGAVTVLGYLERPQRLLDAANAGTAMTLALAGAWLGWTRAADPATAITMMFMYAAIVIVTAHLVPRAIARRWPAECIPLTVPVLQLVQTVMAPMLGAARSLNRGGGDVRSVKTGDVPHEAMQDLLREGELEGVGRHDEIAIINGVMKFGEKSVREIMTARATVFAIPDDADAGSIARQVAHSQFSRVPVYRGSLDHIVGMVHAFDVLKTRDERVPPLRPVAYAPADTRCNELLFRMLKARLHLAVVHDARGQTLGIATLEDLLEELVGDIRDEHDEPAAAAEAGPPAAA